MNFIWKRKNKQPVLSIPLTPAEMVLETVAVIGILFTIFISVNAWPTLPDLIPCHFGFSGIADAWGKKWIIWLFPGVNVIFYMVLTDLSRYPHLFNYPFLITEKNAKQQYQLARSLVCWLKVLVVWIFAFIEWKTILTTLGKAEGLGTMFLPAIIISLFGPVVIYFYLAYRAR